MAAQWQRWRPDSGSGRVEGLEILSLAGVRVVLEYTFFFTLAIFGLWEIQDGGSYFDAGLMCLVVFVSLLAHEGGHALACRYYGQRRVLITLGLFGGATHHDPLSHGRSLIVTLAGPAAGALIVLAVWLLYTRFNAPMARLAESMPGLGPFLGRLLMINIFWTVFNLLPIFPMDGGQALFHVLGFFKPEHRAIRATAAVSILFAALAGLWAFSNRQTFMAFLMISFLATNLQILRSE